MSRFRILTTAVIATSVLVSQLSFGISKEMHALVRMETQSNAVATRDSNFIRLENFVIPLELVESQIAFRANPQFVKSLIFEKNGKKYVRWMINPEDTKWYKEVESFLKLNNVSTEREKHFVAYMTASRSYIVVDPKSGAEFSLKVSTDKTGGNWKDKKQTWDDAFQIKTATDYVQDQQVGKPRLQHAILADEPIAFGIKSIDQGMILRSYQDLTKSGKRYVPGFSIMHENLGRELAKANGSNDPAAYWNDHYNKPLARALAEFFALTGMVYDSPHSQNFLVELDSKNRPTGHIVLRDFGDTFLLSNFFDSVNRHDILEKWEQDNVSNDIVKMAVGILHGNNPPSWMNMSLGDLSGNSYEKWGADFFNTFDDELKNQTGLNLTSNPINRAGNYIQRKYFVDDEIGASFIELVKAGKQRDHSVVKSCEFAFAI